MSVSLLKLIGLPFSFLYGSILAVRNFLFDKGLFKVERFPIPIVSIGNLSVGGTGKTPHVIYFVEQMLKSQHPAIVLRGYGRKTKGVLEVDVTKTVTDVGDEALMYYDKFNHKVPVFVAESRVEGVRSLLQKYPNTSVVVLDDAFQHRHIYRDFNVLLMDFNRPFWKDYVLPVGRLREFRSGVTRSDIVIVTKTPEACENGVKEKMTQKIKRYASKKVFFSQIKYGERIPFFEKNQEYPKQVKAVVLVTGIANPSPLITFLSEKYEVKHIAFNDHYDFTVKDIQEIHNLFDNFAKEEKIIVTTFKDFMRLKNKSFLELIEEYPWFYQPMEVGFEDDDKFERVIDEYVRRN